MNTLFGLHAVKAQLHNITKGAGTLLVQDSRRDGRIKAIIALAKQQEITIQHVDREHLDQLTQGGNHQGVALQTLAQEVKVVDLKALAAQAGDKALFLVLDGVQDPHNLGACLRTADAAGVQAVIIPKNNSCSVTPVVRKVASGAAESVPVVEVSNIAQTLKQLQEAGCWSVGLAGEADQSFYELDLKGPTVLVAGAEGTGMRRLTKEHCDFLAHLPMAGQVSSLNVSVSVGVGLYEIVRQRLALG